MFERFGNRARQVVVRAQEEARNLHHTYIGTEHLLLALAHDHQGMGAKVLESMEAPEDRVRDRLGHYMTPGDPQVTPPGHIPFTPRAKRVLELGLREALQLGHDTIGTEHLLLALIQEADGLAGQTLRDLGVHLNAARERVIALHPPQPGLSSRAETSRRLLGPEPGPARRPLRVEAESLRAEVTRLRALLGRHGIDPGEPPGGEAGSGSAP